jgi:hypothetical protein
MKSIWCVERNIAGYFDDSSVFDEFPRDMHSWAIDKVREKRGKIACADSTDDWDHIMTEMGLNDEIRAVFKKLEHNNIRLMQNLSRWLVKILDTSFEALYFLKHRILDELDSLPVDIRGGGEKTVPQVPEDHIAL